MQIRKAQIEDIDAIISFQKKMAEETENLSLDHQTINAGVKAVFDDPSKGFYQLAESDDKIVACHMVTFEWSDWRDSWIYWIQSLYVIPLYRRQGVFRLMYDHLKESITGNDKVSGIRLYVDSNNQIAQNVYESVGMDGDHYKTYEWMK